MPRRAPTRAFTLASGMLVAACSNAVEPGTSDSSLRIANATTGYIDVWIDGRQWVLGLSMNGLSYILSVPAGSHRVRLGDPIAGMTEGQVETMVDVPQTIVAYPTNVGMSGPAIAVLRDTTPYVPNGKTQLRVANLAAKAGPIEIWYSRPDLPEGSPIMTPFPPDATSPYLESEPGVWEVWISPPGSQAKTVSTGPIEIPGGEQRTVLVLDSAGGPRFVVVAD
jgi:hypothetical protein